MRDHLGQDFKAKRGLDIGCREGTILHSLANHFDHSYGIDVDPFAILAGKRNPDAPSSAGIVADGLCLPFSGASFDVIVCAQVYEHVQDVSALAAEIYRTLKPGGIVFFSGPNRLALMEEHYHLPLLSWLPKRLANFYLRLFRGIQQYEITPLSSRQLRQHLKTFLIHDYTPQLLQKPRQYALEDRIRFNALPAWLAAFLAPLVPNFNWLLMKPESQQQPDSIAYTQDYFVHHCAGHQEFRETHGAKLPRRLTYPLEIAHIQPGQKILDLGSGRGEIVDQCRKKGVDAWGVDFSWEALQLAATFSSFFQQAEAQQLPFRENSFDTVFMLDVVEHLNPAQLQAALSEVRRVLKPGGQLIIHTMPNLWYYRYGYPLYRAYQRLRSQPLPRNPRERWAYAHLHINEQTPATLKDALNAAGFKSKVWLHNVQTFNQGTNPLIGWIMAFLAGRMPFKMIFCNDIFARAIK